MTLKEVLSRNYAKEIYEYAVEHPTADMELLTKVLLGSKKLPERFSTSCFDYDDDYDDYDPDFEDRDLEYYYCIFARDVKGANIELLCKAVADSGDPRYIYEFARDVKGANIQLLEDALDDFYDDYVYKFARDVKGANIKSLESKIAAARPYYIYEFASNVAEADIENLQNILLTDDNIRFGFDGDFCEYVRKFGYLIGSDVDKMIKDIQTFIDNYDKGEGYQPSEYYIERLKETIEYLECASDNYEKYKLKRTKKK